MILKVNLLYVYDFKLIGYIRYNLSRRWFYENFGLLIEISFIFDLF